MRNRTRHSISEYLATRWIRRRRGVDRRFRPGMPDCKTCYSLSSDDRRRDRFPHRNRRRPL